jgi:hypothetical protein
VRDARGDPLKDVLACPGPLLADDTGDPELSGREHALLFKKLPRPAHKGGCVFQTAGLFEEELLQPRCLGVIEGAESQITGDGLLMLGDRRLPFAVEFDQLCIKPQLRCAEANQFLGEPEGLLLRGNDRRAGRRRPDRQSRAGYEAADTCQVARNLLLLGWRLA